MWKNEPAWLERCFIRILNRLKSAIKSVISPHNPLFGYLKSLKKELQPKTEIEAIMHAFAASHKDVYFIQIGAADGISGDPIFGFVKTRRWRGILVEPVPYLFEKLKRNYAGCENLIFENVAISNKEEIKDFWFPKDIPGQPDWFYQLGSFSREIILRHSDAIPELDQMIDRIPLECISLANLLSRNGVVKVDLLQVDTEGYDFEIIKQIDFSSCKPKIIVYEHKHLTTLDRSECAAHLQKQGYQLVEENINTIAFQSLVDNQA